MSSLPRRVGAAMTWKALQLGSDRVITLVRFLVLARLLAPEDFGLLAIATVALDLLLTGTNFGMIPALIQREDREDRHYHAAWTVQLLRGAVVAVVVFAAAPLIAELFGDPRATPLLRYIAFRPLLAALASIRVADLERELDFRALAIVEVPAALVQTVIAIGLAPLIGVDAIVFGMLAGAVAYVVASYVMAPYRPQLTLAREASGALFRYGRWILATGIVGILSETVLRLVISRQLGTVELGLYYMATRLVGIPNGVISVVVGSVTFPLHARLQEHASRAVAAFRANVTALLATLVPVYVGLIALAGPLVRDVLGERWAAAVPAIQLMALGPMFGLVTDAVIPLLQGRGRPQAVTVMILLRSLVLVTVAWPLTRLFGLAGAAVALVVAEVPTQVLAARYADRELPGPFRGLLRPALATLAASGGGAVVGLVVDAWVGPPIGLLPAALAAASLGVGLLVLLDRLLGAGLFAQLGRIFPALHRAPLLRRLVTPSEP